MGCYGGKYAPGNSTNVYDLTCSKAETAYVWETEYLKEVEDQKTTFACINQQCKGAFGTWIDDKLDFLAILGFISCVVCGCCFGLALLI